MTCKACSAPQFFQGKRSSDDLHSVFISITLLAADAQPQTGCMSHVLTVLLTAFPMTQLFWAHVPLQTVRQLQVRHHNMPQTAVCTARTSQLGSSPSPRMASCFKTGKGNVPASRLQQIVRVPQLQTRPQASSFANLKCHNLDTPSSTHFLVCIVPDTILCHFEARIKNASNSDGKTM